MDALDAGELLGGLLLRGRGHALCGLGTRIEALDALVELSSCRRLTSSLLRIPREGLDLHESRTLGRRQLAPGNARPRNDVAALVHRVALQSDRHEGVRGQSPDALVDLPLVMRSRGRGVGKF